VRDYHLTTSATIISPLARIKQGKVYMQLLLLLLLSLLLLCCCYHAAGALL
jgi:hypothetical protein